MKKNVLIIFAVLFVAFSSSCKREDLANDGDSSALRLKSADDTAYLQGLINACPTNGTVTITAGTWNINTGAINDFAGVRGLQLKSNMTLSLASGAILKAIPNSGGVGGTVLDTYNADNVVITGGTIIGDRANPATNESGDCIAVRGSNTVNVNNITVKDGHNDGIDIAYGSTGVTINNVISDNNRRQGISITEANGVVVTNSTFKNTIGTAPQAGIDIEPNAGSTVNNIQITSCQTYGNKGSGVLVTKPNGGTITNVTLDGITSYSNLAGGFSLLNNISGVTVKNSTVYSNTGNGIAVWGNTSSNIINNNKVYSNTVHGITLTNTSTNNTVTNNIVTNNNNRGICLYGVATGNIITGNTATGNPTGDILYYAGNTFSGNLTSAAPIAKYLMNSSSGTNVPDNSGNGHTGTAYTTYAWGAGAIPSRPNYLNALSLNSGNQNTGYVMVPDHAAFDFGTSNFSVSFWVKKNSTSGYAWGVDKWNVGASPTNEWALSLSADGTNSVPRFTIATGSTNYGVTAGTTSILGAWHHVVGVRSGTLLYIYVDGVLRGTLSPAMPAGVSVNNAGRNLYIGGAYSTGSRPNANFDNVRIYNYALTGTQVTELYNYTGNN